MNEAVRKYSKKRKEMRMNVMRPVLFNFVLDYWQVTRPPLTILTWPLESQ